jgi:lysophospholipase L1-like esterase
MKFANIFFLGCLILLTSAQCRKEPASFVPNHVDSGNVVIPPASQAKTFLALGDSYTIGQSVTAGERFPALTVNFLRAAGINMKDPTYIATTGWTTTNLSNAIAGAQLLPPYDIVSLLIGVNDQYQAHDTMGYRDRFRNLLLTSINLAGGKRNHVFVLSIPDYSVTPFASNSDTASIRMQIDWFNEINRQVTTDESCQYLNITPSTREAASDPTLLAGDGLHPSGKEYGKWAARLAPMMQPVLQ